MSLSAFAQHTSVGSIYFDGVYRDYILYVPESYTGEEAVPLLLNFHGYGSNAYTQMYYGDFRPIADREGFILVHPDGTKDDVGYQHWNVGGWTVGSTVDDVGFMEALIQFLMSEYTIDSSRIYATGMSNGGYMSYLLACQLSERIAAIASVTGSMTPETYLGCNPVHPVPVLQIHGTADPVVPYNGNTWSLPVEDVMEFWVQENSCSPSAVVIPLDDVDFTDGSTVELITYGDCESGTAVKFYRVIGGAHTWPGTNYPSPGTNNDIDASEEIWEFFSRYDIQGKRESRRHVRPF